MLNFTGGVLEIEIKDDEFDLRQLRLVELIAESVLESVKDKVKNSDDVAQIVDDITFSFCSIIDGSTVMDVDGKELIPFLTFAKDDSREQLIAADGGSWMHEYAVGLGDELLSNK